MRSKKWPEMLTAAVFYRSGRRQCRSGCCSFNPPESLACGCRNKTLWRINQAVRGRREGQTAGVRLIAKRPSRSAEVTVCINVSRSMCLCVWGWTGLSRATVLRPGSTYWSKQWIKGLSRGQLPFTWSSGSFRAAVGSCCAKKQMRLRLTVQMWPGEDKTCTDPPDGLAPRGFITGLWIGSLPEMWSELEAETLFRQ